MDTRKRVLIVGGRALIRAGLRALLSPEPEIAVVGEAENHRDALALVASTGPDLVIMDLSIPGVGGVEDLREIKRRHASVPVLVLTIHKTDEHVHECLKAGADGYLLKDASQAELRVAVQSVLNGKIYLSPDISDKIIHRYLGRGHAAGPATAWETLTHREREVLKLVAEGCKNKYIASQLALSVKTVEKHRSNLMKKLDLHNAANLTAYAIERGLIVTS